ncbi:DUF2630 family protein [Mucilaginibacter flavidus]|uniref:DUF2630 family protein n=1 Tax=Mucilaginibacter flavidus TaxID=2949309 RepID=UPI0035150A4C
MKSELDKYWDLLRKRRAFRNVGDDPNRAQMRSADTIEHYKSEKGQFINLLYLYILFQLAF